MEGAEWRNRGISVGEFCCDAKEKGKKIILLMRAHGKKSTPGTLQEL